jgi:dTDP-4-dehydrorhamnose reductase/UDP-glucose 4-epimerase
MPEPLTLVVGKSSFLARGFAATPGRPECRFVGHRDLDDASVFDGVDRVVNFALDPRWRREECPAGEDLDARLGRAAAERGLGYVMISSRKVYDPRSQWGADESAPTAPADAYGRNKLASERRLRELLGDRLLVLRVGNVAGYEREPGRRTFMGMLLSGLAERRRVTLDVAPEVPRDFLPDADFHRLLAAALRHGLTGTYNLSSGEATPVGRLAGWVMEGFGGGELDVTDRREHDAFRLDVSRLRQVLGEGWLRTRTLEAHCRDMGRRLAAEREGTRQGA